MATKANERSGEVQIINVERGKATFHLVGTTPMLHNCLSNKTKQELLLPMGRKTEADKKSSLKHRPLEEYQSSIYFNNKEGPTFVQHLSSAFRGAMRAAALDLPGVSKAEVGRMLWVVGDRIDIFGIPQLDMRIVRQAGMNRAPDVRTRCYMQEWACSITVSYVMPQLQLQSVANLLAAAGMYIGIGDYRNEKGAGNYGLFNIAGSDDPDYQRIVAEGGRDVQLAGMKEPNFSNEETEELYTWYLDAVGKHRSFAPATANGRAKTKVQEITSNGVEA